MSTQDDPFHEARGLDNQGFSNQGFTTEDILWAVGIWSAILTLSPIIMFYVLMVA